MDLVIWLEGRRGELTNDAFARSLGMSPSMWSRILRRRRPITHADLGKILARYPDQCHEIIALWRDGRAA